MAIPTSSIHRKRYHETAHSSGEARATQASEGMSNGGIESILQRSDIWRASDTGAGLCDQHQVTSTGYAMLDHYLPNHGWSAGHLVELLCDQKGIGELNLLMPSLGALSQTQWLVFINPPYIPYAPALAAAGINLDNLLIVNAPDIKDQLWVMEQVLSSESCAAVLSWASYIHEKQLRRLQAASTQHQSLGFLFRSLDCLQNSSPAHIRIQLSQEFLCHKSSDAKRVSQNKKLKVKVVKRPNAWASPEFELQVARPLLTEQQLFEIDMSTSAVGINSRSGANESPIMKPFSQHDVAQQELAQIHIMSTDSESPSANKSLLPN